MAPDNAAEISAIEAVAGRLLGYVQAVGRRRGETPLADPWYPIPSQYVKKPLLRSEV